MGRVSRRTRADADFLRELAAAVPPLVERHLATQRDWLPHEFVPWSRGRDFEPDEEWDPGEFPLPEGVRSALFVNLLTEDNLPHYFATITHVFGATEPWTEWSFRWTAEEHRHSIAIRDYLTVTRAVDPVALERARMAQVSGGQVPRPDSPLDGVCYVAMQELATRVAHRNTGTRLDDPVGQRLMKRVAMDENLHYLFYRDLATRARDIDPSRFMVSLDRQVRGFAMPGTGITDFNRHSRAIAREGIYDLAVHHDHVLVPTVERTWEIESLEGLDAEGEQARRRLLDHMARLARLSERLRERRSSRSTRVADQHQDPARA